MELLVTALVIAAFGGGFLAGRLTCSPTRSDDLEKKLELTRHELAVVIRVMEEAGVKFHRDYERNVTGLVQTVTARIEGTGVTANG